MFFFLRNSSPLFSITRSGSFFVIHVSVSIKNNAEKYTTLLLFWISLVFWATELDTSLPSSICQPASINKSNSGNRVRYGFISCSIRWRGYHNQFVSNLARKICRLLQCIFLFKAFTELSSSKMSK